MTRRLPETYLAEVFGFPSDVRDDDVELFRSLCLCPFRPMRPDASRDLSLPHREVPFDQQFARCTKNSVIHPLGVCSVYAGTQPAITCPVRFGEGETMLNATKEWVASVLQTPAELMMAIPEIRLVPGAADISRPEVSDSGSEVEVISGSKDASAGNIDYVLASVYTDQVGSNIMADYYLGHYAALEVQAVYISGNVSNPFSEFMGGQRWDGSNPPRPDWLSSSRKRLVPQLAWKGSILHAWNIPVAVCVQLAFWKTMPYLSAVTDVAETFPDMAWVIVDLERRGRTYQLIHVNTLSSQFETALTAATKAPAGSGYLVEQAIIGKAILLLTGSKPRRPKPSKVKRR
ncbi:NotI family restriction endonuclease [Deinococcus sp.]|uniref:NotI family restriction endonuclease n=1 Tax=Deinococcus sp. TaxID=47478 RepID=UPI003CC53897